jgi:hypothetical protein
MSFTIFNAIATIVAAIALIILGLVLQSLFIKWPQRLKKAKYGDISYLAKLRKLAGNWPTCAVGELFPDSIDEHENVRMSVYAAGKKRDLGLKFTRAVAEMYMATSEEAFEMYRTEAFELYHELRRLKIEEEKYLKRVEDFPRHA